MAMIHEITMRFRDAHREANGWRNLVDVAQEDLEEAITDGFDEIEILDGSITAARFKIVGSLDIFIKAFHFNENLVLASLYKLVSINSKEV